METIFSNQTTRDTFVFITRYESDFVAYLNGKISRSIDLDQWNETTVYDLADVIQRAMFDRIKYDSMTPDQQYFCGLHIVDFIEIAAEFFRLVNAERNKEVGHA